MRIESLPQSTFRFLSEEGEREKKKKKNLIDLESINVNAMKLHFCYMGCLENDMHAFQFNISCCLDFIVS